MMQLVVYYLPIYFQAIKGASPMMSGVYLLPTIVSHLIGTIVSGVAGQFFFTCADEDEYILLTDWISVTKIGYYLPFSVASGILASIGHGILSTLSPYTSTGKWIGYQIIIGVARGIGLQMPFVAVQNNLSPTLVSISLSLLTFSQTFTGAVALTIGETIFTNSLKTTIPIYAQGVNPETVIEAGATGFRACITNSTELAGVLVAYSKSVNRVFYLAIGCSCACFLCAWGKGWKDIRKKPESNIPREDQEA